MEETALRDSTIWEAAAAGVGVDWVAVVDVEGGLDEVVVKRAVPKGGLRKHRTKEPSTSSTGLDVDVW